MNKRIISLILCAVLLMSFIPVSAHADEVTFYQVRIDAGNGVKTEKAIVEDGEIYIPAASFSKYTRFEYNEAKSAFLVKGQEYDKAFKRVVVNAEKKKAAVGTQMIDLSNSFVVDGVPYLPFCQMLPILNASIIDVDEGIIYIVNNELSMAELLYNFNLEDYAFNISEEFFRDEDRAKKYVVWAYLVDTVKDFRLDRLDIVFKSGESKDYQEIFTEYMKDDELFHEAMGSHENFAGYLLETIVDLNSETESFYTVYEWFEAVEKSDSANKVIRFLQETSDDSVFEEDWYQIINVIHSDEIEISSGESVKLPFSVADFYEAAGYVYSYMKQIEDHTKMLDAVYGLTISGKSASLFSVNPEAGAADKIYHAYKDEFVPAMSKKIAETVVVKCVEEVIEDSTLGFYKLTFGLAGEVIDAVWPGDVGERAVLMYHANIVNTAKSKACVPSLMTEDETDDYRLSLLLTLIASRACYKTMAENENGYQQYRDYYKEKIQKIENMIMGLYLVADNVAFDTYENYEKFAQENLDVIEESGVLTSLEQYAYFENIYLEFLENHPEYNYYAVLDINKDGMFELFATDDVTDDFSPEYLFDVFVYRDGKICIGYEDIWAKYSSLEYDSVNEWFCIPHGGTSGGGFSFYYIDDESNVQTISYDLRCHGVDEQGNEVWTQYYNDEVVNEETRDKYDWLYERHQSECKNTKSIVFQAIPKTALPETQTLKERVEEIRTLYYHIQGNLSDYQMLNDSETTAYWDSNGNIKKITASQMAYVDFDSNYNAEYFYDDDCVFFIFLYNNDEEHRIYLKKNDYRTCVRYIDSNGVTHDYPDGIDTGELTVVGEYASWAMAELHWRGIV